VTYPSAPPPRRRTGRIVLIVAAIVLVLCCAGAIGIAVFVSTLGKATGPAKDRAEEFIGYLDVGQTDAAYADLCGPTKGRFSAPEFAQIVRGRPKLSSYTVTSTNVSNVNGRVSGTVRATLTYVDGSSENHVFELVKEGDDWRVCGNPY
jgi:hypothetical protein